MIRWKIGSTRLYDNAMAEQQDLVSDELLEVDVEQGIESDKERTGDSEHEGAGVHALNRLIARTGMPDVADVVHLMERFPKHQDAMLRELHRKLGNTYVQQVSNALVIQRAAHPDRYDENAPDAPE